MQQYFISNKAKKDDRVMLDEEQSHHISHVMRMRQGDVVRIVDKEQHIFLAHIELHNKNVYAHLYDELEDHTKLSVEITLLQGMIKGEKWDYVLQKSSELGVCKIVPFTSSRSVVKNIDEKVDKKMQRWNKICREACEQCKRSTLVNVEKPISLHDAHNYMSDLNIIAYEDAGTSERLCDLLSNHPTVESITIVVGCEGGFDIQEVNLLEEKGFYRVSLGTRILRAETASLSLVNNIGFYYDMIGGKHG